MSREHYIIEASIKRIYREPTGAMKYNSEAKQNEPEYGERKHDEIIKLVKKAPTLKDAVRRTVRHLGVELEDAEVEE